MSHFNLFNLDNGDKMWSTTWTTTTTSVADLEVGSSQVDLELDAGDDGGAVYGIKAVSWSSGHPVNMEEMQLAVCGEERSVYVCKEHASAA